MSNRKFKAGYYLLYRREERDRVWLYEYLQNHEVKARLRDGWQISR
ncbi:hypothetical protein [Gracilibacillus halophilus]|nr:hypothetical protein [Gracilibacillus halophilus]